MSSKISDFSRKHIIRATKILLLFSVILTVAATSLSSSDELQYTTYAQEESFLEICDNLIDDDGDGYADVDDPEGCSPPLDEGGGEEVDIPSVDDGGAVPDEATPPTQDTITYPDGTTCDPNTQSCPPLTYPDGTTCDPNTQSCPPLPSPSPSPSPALPQEEGAAPVTTTCDPNAQTLKKGNTGEIVVTLQNLLVEKGYNPGPVDGDFGPGTDSAVKQFQTDNGLTADGIVGRATWQALCSTAVSPSDETSGIMSCPDGSVGTSCPAEAPTETPAETPAPMGAQVSVWINAFIPRDISGITEPVPGGPYAGQTMIHGPVPGVSDCYLTDNRGFSPNEAASARMHSQMNIDITGTTPTEISQVHRIGDTHEVDCEDGDVEGTGTASNTRMQFTNLRSSSPGIIEVDVKGAANNPLATGSPDIDYQGTFTIDTTARTVSFQGLIDSFPAFEAYASVDGDPNGKEIFVTPPPPGNTPRDLFGDASTSVSGTATFS